MNEIAPNDPGTAPKDGRVIRGYFSYDHGAEFRAVSWHPERQAWVDLLGEEIPQHMVLIAWSED